jgi:hypothetical protein
MIIKKFVDIEENERFDECGFNGELFCLELSTYLIDCLVHTLDLQEILLSLFKLGENL